MRILLTGATGFVGSHLTERLTAAGHEVRPVSRRPTAGGYDWSEESLSRGVAEADAVIHLAGENLFSRRWSAKQKELLRTSRIETTVQLARLAKRQKPSFFLSASAVGYYGPSRTGELDESSPAGADFLARLCGEWEDPVSSVSQAGVRTAVLRIGVVLGAGGGALGKMLLPFRLGLGGPLGSGDQWLSWIHTDDLAQLVLFLLDHPEASGVFNATAPHPVTNREFSKTLGQVLHRPAVLPTPGFALRLALGEAADALLTGQHVVPRRALEAGFEFRFPRLEEALADLLTEAGPAAPVEGHG